MNAKIDTSLEGILSRFAAEPFTKREEIAGYQAGQTEGEDTSTV